MGCQRSRHVECGRNAPVSRLIPRLARVIRVPMQTKTAKATSHPATQARRLLYHSEKSWRAGPCDGDNKARVWLRTLRLYPFQQALRVDTGRRHYSSRKRINFRSSDETPMQQSRRCPWRLANGVRSTPKNEGPAVLPHAFEPARRAGAFAESLDEFLTTGRSIVTASIGFVPDAIVPVTLS